MSYGNLVPQIMEAIGTEKNVKSLVHCSTRLRFKVYDMNKVDIEKLKGMSQIAGVKEQSDGVQLIIGQDVDEAYDLIMKNYQIDSVKQAAKTNCNETSKKKENPFFRAMGWIA